MAKNIDKRVEQSLGLLARSSLIVLFGVILSKILTYAYKIVIARAFGPELYGVFSLALIIFNIFVTIGALGLSEGLLRYVALYGRDKDKSKARQIIKISFTVSLISGIISAVLLFLFAEQISLKIFHNPELALYLKVFSFAIPFSILSGIFLSVIRAKERINLYTFIINIFSNGIKLLLLFLFVLIGLKSRAIISSYSLGIIGVAIISYIYCKYSLAKLFSAKALPDKERKELNGELLSYSLPILFLGVINTLFYWIDSFVIGYLKNTTEVGLYNIAFTLVALFGIAPELFMQLFFPLILKEFSKQRIALIKELSKQVAKWILILNLPAFILIFIFPGAAINILFGKEYLAAEGALRVLSVAGVLSSFSTLMNNLLSMKGKSKTILLNLIVTSVINLALNILLVPRYGIMGAAIATSSSWILLNIMVFVEVRHYLSITPLRRKMFRVVLAAIIPTFLLILSSKYIIINIISIILLSSLFGIFYLYLIFRVGCLDRNDIAIINNIKSSILKYK